MGDDAEEGPQVKDRSGVDGQVLVQTRVGGQFRYPHGQEVKRRKRHEQGQPEKQRSPLPVVRKQFLDGSLGHRLRHGGLQRRQFGQRFATHLSQELIRLFQRPLGLGFEQKIE